MVQTEVDDNICGGKVVHNVERWNHNSQVDVGSEHPEQVISDPEHSPVQHLPLHPPQQGNRIPQPPDTALFLANLGDPLKVVYFFISKVLYQIQLLEEQVIVY